MRKLFQDNKLLGTIDGLLKVFVPHPALALVSSEKGAFTAQQTSFSAESIFSFVEDNLLGSSNYCFLDDLGGEWADHILLSSDTITFVLSKYDVTTLSATSLHEVIGQALKNLGNFTPPSEKLDVNKQNIWSQSYNARGVTTSIGRLRKGRSVIDGINEYKNLLVNPNMKKKIVLAINFLSLQTLEDRFRKLANEEHFAEKNQVSQILWIISGLINCCKENGIELNIFCKP